MSVATTAFAPQPAGYYDYRPSPPPHMAQPGKRISFELALPGGAQERSRHHMRVQIWPHDDTESIVTTVKNFFAISPPPGRTVGVSFEDPEGTTLIARYENFTDGMTVLVRAIDEPPVELHSAYRSAPVFGGHGALPHHFPQLESHHSQQQQVSEHHHHLSAEHHHQIDHDTRHHAAALVVLSQSESPVQLSPSSSADGMFYKHAASPLLRKDSDATVPPDYCESDASSSGDDTASDAASHPKDPIPTTDISVENIVEGGRRKRLRHESVEPSLFAPRQMPATSSTNQSGSPVRRANHHHHASMPVVPTHNASGHFAPDRSLPSPHPNYRHHHSSSHSYHDFNHLQNAFFAPPAPSFAPRHRNSISHTGGRPYGDTPVTAPYAAPLSDEDRTVAHQLISLRGEDSPGASDQNGFDYSHRKHSRHDGASNASATTAEMMDSSEDDAAAAAAHRHTASISSSSSSSTNGYTAVYPGYEGQHFAPFPHESPLAVRPPPQSESAHPQQQQQQQVRPKPGQLKTALPTAKPRTSIKIKRTKGLATGNGVAKHKKVPSQSGAMQSPSSTSPVHTQAMSSLLSIIGNATYGDDDDDVVDLSSKPRCQRCRKSKKGCDRQRPCGRCKDAGLCATDCISEDEGNGRKGRYGRHMGVPLNPKKEDTAAAPVSPPPPVALQPGPLLLPAPAAGAGAAAPVSESSEGASLTALGVISEEAASALDNNKKRKR
jgi:hypothetical protein